MNYFDNNIKARHQPRQISPYLNAVRRPLGQLLQVILLFLREKVGSLAWVFGWKHFYLVAVDVGGTEALWPRPFHLDGIQSLHFHS